MSDGVMVISGDALWSSRFYPSNENDFLIA